MASFHHRDGAGTWHSFNAEHNRVLEEAYQAGTPSVRLPSMAGNPPGHRDFEVRFGDAAFSARMPTPPETRIIQVNVENGNTRVVRREPDRRAADPIGAAIQMTNDFAASSALYGWMLRKQLSGWRRNCRHVRASCGLTWDSFHISF